MTPEEKVWLVETLSHPGVRALLERLAPRSETLAGLLRLAQARDRARARLDAGGDTIPPTAR